MNFKNYSFFKDFLIRKFYKYVFGKIGMRKRIIIFSPYLKDRDELEYVVTDYLKSRKSFDREIEIQKFSDIGESIREGYRIGSGGEILVFFRRLHSKRESAWAGKEERIRFKFLKILLELSKKVCDEEGIPYLMYEEEIEKEKKDILMKKLNGIDKLVLYRLERLKN